MCSHGLYGSSFKIRINVDRFKKITCAGNIGDALVRFFVENPPAHNHGLYHYTSILSFTKILESNTMLLSAANELNDLQEPSDDNVYIGSFSYGGIENVAMWGIYAQPLKASVRLKFTYLELKHLVESSGKEGCLLPVVERNGEYRVLYECGSAVSVIGKNLLSDVLYVDYYSGKRDKVMVRWNNQALSVPIGVVEDLRKRQLLGLVKYSGWAYERETRICVQAKINEGLARGKEEGGWKLSKGRLALWLNPDIIKSCSVIGGPCVSQEDLRAKINATKMNNGSIKVSEIGESKLRGLLRGGIFCRGCADTEHCRTYHAS